MYPHSSVYVRTHEKRSRCARRRTHALYIKAGTRTRSDVHSGRDRITITNDS